MHGGAPGSGAPLRNKNVLKKVVVWPFEPMFDNIMGYRLHHHRFPGMNIQAAEDGDGEVEGWGGISMALSNIPRRYDWSS